MFYFVAFSGPPPTAPQIVGMILFFIVWFVFVAHVIARMSGWKTLAKRFQYDAPFTGTIWRWQCARFRYGMNYNNCLTVGVNQEGLYLAMMPILNFGHVPLLIPWTEITEQGKDSFFGPVFVLTLGREERIPMTIRSKLALKIEQAKTQHYPVG